jgi:hypothetical protein
MANLGQKIILDKFVGKMCLKSWVVQALVVGTLACLPGLCQSTDGQSAERLRISHPISDARPQTTVRTALSGNAEQQEFIDPPFREAPGLIDTPPINGKASPFNWLLMPHAGEGTFKRWLEGAHPGFALYAEKNDPNEFIEIVGEHQALGPKAHICGIYCRRVLMDAAFIQLGTSRKLLGARPPKVLIYEVSCSCSLQDPEALKQFVKQGGYLILTGRDMRGIEQVFPGRITSAQGKTRIDTLVDAKLYNPDQILCTNLVTNARWYVPRGAPPIKVVNPQAVRVLCTSQQLAAEVPDGQGVLAAMFAYGKGYVLCMVGTLDNNAGHINADNGISKSASREDLPDPAPKIHVSLRQGLAANFIEAGLTKKRIPTGIDPSFTQMP